MLVHKTIRRLGTTAKPERSREEGTQMGTHTDLSVLVIN